MHWQQYNKYRYHIADVSSTETYTETIDVVTTEYGDTTPTRYMATTHKPDTESEHPTTRHKENDLLLIIIVSAAVLGVTLLTTVTAIIAYEIRNMDTKIIVREALHNEEYECRRGKEGYNA